MNCHHFRATQKSIPDAQELIWLGGGIECPPPADKGLIGAAKGYDYIEKQKFKALDTNSLSIKTN